MSGRIDSVYPIIKGAELTPLAAHFGRDSPRRKKEERKMGGEGEWTPPKERERERRRFICREIDDGDATIREVQSTSPSEDQTYCLLNSLVINPNQKWQETVSIGA